VTQTRPKRRDWPGAGLGNRRTSAVCKLLRHRVSSLRSDQRRVRIAALQIGRSWREWCPKGWRRRKWQTNALAVAVGPGWRRNLPLV